MENLITLKTTPAARKALRLIAANTSEKHWEVLERVLVAEKQRLTAPLTAAAQPE